MASDSAGTDPQSVAAASGRPSSAIKASESV